MEQIGMIIAAAVLAFVWGAVFFKEETQNRRWLFSAVQAMLCIGLMYLFERYQYHPVKSFRCLVLVLFMIRLGTIDARQRKLPNRILAIMFAVRTAFLAVECIAAKEYWMELILSALIGMAFIGIFFFIVWVLSRKGLGAGDVKLMAVLGYWVGFSVAIGIILIALILTVVVGLVQVARKKMSLRDALPMGPFLAVGTIVALALGIY